MNTKIKMTVAMLAGIIAGAMLVSTAVAAPRTMSSTAFDGNGMMRSVYGSSTFDRPTIAEMNAFMSGYRTASGSIDVNRMHADVASGRVTPPHMQGVSGAERATKSRIGRSAYRRGSTMMQGWPSDSVTTGYRMMGSSY
jgi:hypothetical protein